MFTANGTAKYYKEIMRKDTASAITNMKRLITAEAFKNHPREVVSRITRLITGNEDIS